MAAVIDTKTLYKIRLFIRTVEKKMLDGDWLMTSYQFPPASDRHSPPPPPPHLTNWLQQIHHMKTRHHGNGFHVQLMTRRVTLQPLAHKLKCIRVQPIVFSTTTTTPTSIKSSPSSGRWACERHCKCSSLGISGGSTDSQSNMFSLAHLSTHSETWVTWLTLSGCNWPNSATRSMGAEIYATFGSILCR